jgi:putative transcriptional regulator
MLVRLAAIAFLIQTAQAQLAPGKLLIATRKSHDPDLSQTVVLLIHCDQDGAIGLILNHPTKTSTYFGGPIALGVRALLRSRNQPPGAEHVIADIWTTSQIDKLAGVYRVYAGYTGWSMDQLQDEVSLGLWRILPGDSRTVFDPNPATLWSRLLR